jgi:hypothetical protein
MTRSGLRPWKTCRSPSPSSPSSREAGTTTSSKNKVNCFSGACTLTGISVFASPAASVSTMNSDSCPRSLPWWVPVLATTRIASLSSTPEV